MNECKYFSSNVNIYRESESVCICSVTVQYRTYIAKEHKPLYIYIYIYNTPWVYLTFKECSGQLCLGARGKSGLVVRSKPWAGSGGPGSFTSCLPKASFHLSSFIPTLGCGARSILVCDRFLSTLYINRLTDRDRVK